MSQSQTVHWTGTTGLVSVVVSPPDGPLLCGPTGLTCDHFFVTFVGSGSADRVATVTVAATPNHDDVVVYDSGGPRVKHQTQPGGNATIVKFVPGNDTYDITVIGSLALNGYYEGTLEYHS